MKTLQLRVQVPNNSSTFFSNYWSSGSFLNFLYAARYCCGKNFLQNKLLLVLISRNMKKKLDFGKRNLKLNFLN